MKNSFIMSKVPLPAVVAFTRVAHHASFTRAAAELQLSPSALSQTIRALEARLGVRLFNRTTRRVGLTEHGAHFLERVLPAFVQIDEALDELDSTRGVPSGTLRITLPRVVATRLVLPRLAEFRARYPQIVLELSAVDTLVDLIAGGFDAGIRLGEVLARNMVAVAVSPPAELAVVASPGYLSTHGVPRTLDDLAAHDCIRIRRPGGRLYAWEFTERGRDLQVQVDGAVIVNEGGLARQAALGGGGLAQPLLIEVAEDLARGQLVRVLQELTPPFDGFFLYYPAREHLPTKLRAFVDFMRWTPRRAKATARGTRRR